MSPRTLHATEREVCTLLHIENGSLVAETDSYRAVFKDGFLTSFANRSTGADMVRPFDTESASPLELHFKGGKSLPVMTPSVRRVNMHLFGSNRAVISFEGYYADGHLTVSTDPESGDLLVEPSAYANRQGALAVRWNLFGLDPGVRLIAPLFQGTELPLGDSLIAGDRQPWPLFWEAGMLMLHQGEGGMWIHCRDTQYRYKALQIGRPKGTTSLGLESEAYGPVDSNRACGGIAWRLAPYSGDWTVPAGQYREWLRDAFGLERRMAERPEWMDDIDMAISWCPTHIPLLEALAGTVAPERVLLHVPNWREYPYDENYPEFVASDEGAEFMRTAQEMGFRVLPHCNSVDMDPSHPLYDQVRDFSYRSVEDGSLHGWVWWHTEEGPASDINGVPQSFSQLKAHQHHKVMIKIHPGLTAWRLELARQIERAATMHDLSAVFLDVTLTSGNLEQSLVESTTSTEGMLRIIDEIAGATETGLVVGGEGRNEITAQGLTFAQVHLFKSWQRNLPGFERAAHPLNEFLFEGLCRSFGYTALGGGTEESRLRMSVHETQSAIPTITVHGSRDITEPNNAVRRVLEGVRGPIR